MATADQLAGALNGTNVAYLAELYTQWVKDPKSVDSSFAILFEAMDDTGSVVERDARGASWAPRAFKIDEQDKPAEKQKEKTALKDGQISKEQIYAAADDSLRVTQMIRAYRVRGHMESHLDPLELDKNESYPELDPQTYGFGPNDLDRPIYLGKLIAHFLPGDVHTIREILTALRRVYCGSIGWEFMHIQDYAKRKWLLERIEGENWKQFYKSEDKKQFLHDLTSAVGFEAFCQKRFAGVKRFGLDGGEVTIPALKLLIKRAAHHDVEAIVFGMAHRGRLNVLTNIIGKPYSAVFSEFFGKSFKPDFIPGTADVKYHLGYSSMVEVEGKKLDISLAFNPSHLEAVGPVVEGKTRALQDNYKGTTRKKHMAVLIHGDAAFAGQGIVYETMSMSQLVGYKTGGTIHVVINNKIGFTTLSTHAYSGFYCTDVAKAARAPIFHINGDVPEAVMYAMQLAVDYREEFGTDVVLDIVCYRRHGHNESDEPSFTQPIMYEAIRKHETIRQLYADQLVKEGCISEADAHNSWIEFQSHLQAAYNTAKDYRPNDVHWIAKDWQEMQWRGQHRKMMTTGVSKDDLKRIGNALYTVPADFHCHPKLLRQLEVKRNMFESGNGIDWATGEALAFGSLLIEGHRVRLSGQDCQRGTFSNRNAVLIDQRDQNSYVPLNHIQDVQAQIRIYNSHLSEFGVLGFEYGYSQASPNMLVLWEAQFGDFANGAQIIIDQFISAGESKWLQMSGLVLLLPHGQEGQGAEHSSARLERFLQLCGEENMQVCNLTTPASYFHALRRQLKRNYRQPLVIMTPKSLLRHKLALSSLSDFTTGTEFQPVIGEIDTNLVAPDKIKRVVLCSGKVYYDLLARRRELELDQVALIRLEQLYPFPADQLKKILSTYSKAKIIWCQEETQNMGAWQFVDRQIGSILKEIKHPTLQLDYVGRSIAASPAPGLASTFKEEQDRLVDQALGCV